MIAIVPPPRIYRPKYLTAMPKNFSATQTIHSTAHARSCASYRYASEASGSVWLLVLGVHLIVQLAGPLGAIAEPAANGSNKDKSEQSHTVSSGKLPAIIQNKDLPTLVAEMRDAILSAVQSGRMDDLQAALEWNELTPELSVGEDTNASASEIIDRWKAQSPQAQGRDILAILADLLTLPSTTLPLGRDLENHDVYVWPYLSQIPLDKLTPPQVVELYRLMPADEADAIIKTGKWTWYRVTIGADGTWHSFIKHK